MGSWSFWSCLMQIDPLLTKICAKNEFYIFVPSDLEPYIVTFVQRYVSTKLEVSKANLFEKIKGMWRTDGQTEDGVQHLMRHTREGRIINVIILHSGMYRTDEWMKVWNRSLETMFPRANVYVIHIFCLSNTLFSVYKKNFGCGVSGNRLVPRHWIHTVAYVTDFYNDVESSQIN